MSLRWKYWGQDPVVLVNPNPYYWHWTAPVLPPFICCSRQWAIYASPLSPLCCHSTYNIGIAMAKSCKEQSSPSVEKQPQALPARLGPGGLGAKNIEDKIRSFWLTRTPIIGTRQLLYWPLLYVAIDSGQCMHSPRAPCVTIQHTTLELPWQCRAKNNPHLPSRNSRRHWQPDSALEVSALKILRTRSGRSATTASADMNQQSPTPPWEITNTSDRVTPRYTYTL